MKKLIDILALLAFFIFWILIYVGIVMYLNKRYIPDYLFGLAFYSLLAGLGFLSVSVFLGIFSFLIKKAVHKHWFRFILKKLNIRYPKAIGLWLKGVISFIEGCFSHPGGGIPTKKKGDYNFFCSVYGINVVMYTLKGTRIFLYLTPLQKRQFHSLDFWLTLETGIPAFIRDAEELPDVFGDSLDAVQESNHDTTGWGKPSFNPEETTPGFEDDSGEEWKKDE